MAARETGIEAQCIPVLASLDMVETRAFYTEQLGFSEIVHEARDYLIVRRGGMELHFWLADDRHFPEHTSCFIRGVGIEVLHREYLARGAPGLSTFEVRPWNMKEFYIHDPHGNLPRFGCAPDEA